MSKFRNPATRVRINPETYIKFDGSDKLMLSNVFSGQAVSMKSDILLILWDMTDWRTVGEITTPWPPDDQEKIISHLEMFYEAKIVVCDEAELSQPTESGLAEHLGNKIHINVENHHHMLRDYVRLAAYRRAIEKAVKADTVALDLGCGTGILSFFAAQAGAQKIYAVEKRPDIILLAQALADANGFQQIEFLEGSSSVLKEAQFQPKADLFVSEILGNGILEENVLEFTLDARQRFLKPGAKMIPARLEIYVFAFNNELKSDRWPEVREFKDLYGVDYTLFGEVLCNKATLRMERYSTALNQTMSEAQKIKTIDFHTYETSIFAEEFELEALHNGEITGFCSYFKAYLDEDTVLTNSPWAPPTHWTNLVYTLPAPRTVKKGEKIPMSMIYDGSMRLQIREPGVTGDEA